MAKKSKKADKKTKISISEWLFAKKEIIVGIAGGLAALYPIVNFMYNLSYQSKCEGFYGVPGKYFHSTIDNRLLYLACILILIIICATPIIIRKYDEKKQVQVKGSTVYVSFVAAVVGMEIGFLNVYNLLEIMKQTHKTYDWIRSVNNFLDKNATITITVVIVAGTIALLGITLIDKIRAIKWRWIKIVINCVFIFSFAISLLLMIYGTIFKLGISVEDKTKYEVVTIDEEDYVVLSEHDDKILVVLYEVKENGQYIFDTSKYWFYEKYQGTHRYINLKYCPEISKEGEDVCE